MAAESLKPAGTRLLKRDLLHHPEPLRSIHPTSHSNLAERHSTGGHGRNKSNDQAAASLERPFIYLSQVSARLNMKHGVITPNGISSKVKDSENWNSAKISGRITRGRPSLHPNDLS